MESFDQALKYLVHHEPAEFLRFALENRAIDILEALPAALPTRGRDVDACYLISLEGKPTVAHFEFHRRNQGLDELATDIAEAQIRLFRREDKLVLTLLWDLYGDPDEPFLESRSLRYGRAPNRRGSEAVYLRINLRAVLWKEFMRYAPPVLWPLVALTKDGAQDEAVIEARDAIKAQRNLGFSDQADYLAILWFVASAEHVPQHVLRQLLKDEEYIMASDYYQSVIEKGKAQGKVLGFLEGEAQGIVKGEAQGIVKGEAQGIVKGEAQALAATVVNILERRLGSVNHDVRKRILAVTNLTTLRAWHDMAIDAVDVERAQRIVQTIRKTRTT